MSKAINHIIQKQTLQVTFSHSYNAAALQENIKRIYYEKILPLFDNLFSEFVKDDLIIRLDTVNLDLGHLREADLETQMIEKIIPVIRNELQSRLQFEVKDSSHIRLLSARQSSINGFIYFLKSGYLPWWCPLHDLALLESEITKNYTANNHLPEALLKLINANHHSLARLNFQFSEQFKYFLVEKVCPTKAMKEELATKLFLVYDKEKDVILKKNSEANRNTESVFKKDGSFINEEILPETNSDVQKSKEQETRHKAEEKKISIHSPSSINDITENTNQDHSNKNFENKFIQDVENSKIDRTERTRKSISDQMRQNPVSATEQSEDKDFDGENIYLDLAGLVILHPFIPQFLDAFGFTKENVFINEEATHEAVRLLGYIATDETALQEQILLLPKLLCGIGFNESIKKEITITPEQEKEVTELLSAVISYWGALKNTSPNGLRNMFLKRAGKLSPREGGWQLDIERKTWDILLGKLPWGISIIKLPWMKQILFVNWQ